MNENKTADQRPLNHQSTRRNSTIYRIVICAVFAAFVYIFTLLSIPVGIGYVHLGDVFILLGCVSLGWWAILPAIIGSVLADITLGYVWWVPGTFVVKGAMAAVCLAIAGHKANGGLRTAAAFVVSSLVMQVGYLAYQSIALLVYNPMGAVIRDIFLPIALLLNMIQTFVCVPIAYAAVVALQRLKVIDKVRDFHK